MRYEDQSHTGGNVLDGPNVIDVDPFSPVTLNRLPSQVIIADRGDEHDLRAGSPGRHGLIGALATGRGRERVSQHGLPGRGKHGHAHGHIRIARANNDHPWILDWRFCILDWGFNKLNHWRDLHSSDCRLWSFITKSTRGIHTG